MTENKVERELAIDELKVSISVAWLEFWQGKSYSNFKLHKETIETAISALRAQSESEKKIERAIAECKRQIRVVNDIHIWDILEILEEDNA